MKRKNGFGWSEFIVGLLLILLGVFTFVRPEGMLTGAVMIYGVIAVVLGIEDIMVYSRVSRFTGFGPTLSLVSGILSVMCGVMLIANPDVGKWALTILVPVWFIAHCISGLTRAGFIRMLGSGFYYCLSMILNIFGLILGFLMLLSPALSFVTVRAVCYAAAVYLILFGAESVVSAFFRGRSGR